MERWFAELTNRWLRRGTHHSTRELVASIRTWIQLARIGPHPRPVLQAQVEVPGPISEPSRFVFHGDSPTPAELARLAQRDKTREGHDGWYGLDVDTFRDMDGPTVHVECPCGVNMRVRAARLNRAAPASLPGVLWYDPGGALHQTRPGFSAPGGRRRTSPG